MSKKRNLLLILFTVLTSVSIGQKRIGCDVNTRLIDLNFTVHYHQVIKRNVLFSTGVFFGLMGMANVDNSITTLYEGNSVLSPYSEANRTVTDSITSYQLVDYGTSGSGMGIHVGLGYFHEFSVVHGIRSNLNYRIGFVETKLGGYYYSTAENLEIYRVQRFHHFVGAINLEIYHTVRLNGRMTFYYGLKMPYYFSMDKAKFNPRTTKDLFSGFEPDLSIGITRVIGKCD